MSVKTYTDDPVLRAIGSAADSRNIDVYVVGGYVRDLLLGRTLRIPISLLWEAESNSRNMWARDAGYRLRPFCSRILVLHAYDRRPQSGDLSVRAKKVTTRLHRNLLLHRALLERRSSRRDFTVNAMAVKSREETFGKLVDPFRGQRRFAG